MSLDKPIPGEESEVQDDTSEGCCCYTAPRTLVATGILQLGSLVVAHAIPRRRGWWPVLDSVSMVSVWDGNAVFEEPASAIGFFYAWDRDLVTGVQAVPSPPPPIFPDASLAYSQIFSSSLGPGGGITGWRRYAVDVPARRDAGDQPCQLFAALILTNPGALISGNPAAAGSIRIVYRYRKACGEAC